jgi:hypothetical protein
MLRKFCFFFYFILLFTLLNVCVSTAGPPRYMDYKGVPKKKMELIDNPNLIMHKMVYWNEILRGKDKRTDIQLLAPYAIFKPMINEKGDIDWDYGGGVTDGSNFLTVIHVDASVSDESIFNELRKIVKEKIENIRLIKGPYTLPLNFGSRPVFEIYSGNDRIIGFEANWIIALKKSDKFNYKYVVYGAFHFLPKHYKGQRNDIYPYDRYETDFLSMLGTIR